MRIGAIFARGSCRALKWTAVLGALVVLGSSQVSAQTISPLYPDHVSSHRHAVVDDNGTDTVVLIPMSAGVEITAETVSTVPPIVNAIEDAFSITGTYDITGVTRADWQTSGDNQIVQVTLDRSISVGDVPILTYTYPGTAHNRLQASATPNADVASFTVSVNPARPELPVRAGSPTFLDLGGRSFTIHSGGAVNWSLPGVEKGGMLDLTDTANPYIQYSAVGATAGDGANSQTGFTAVVGGTTLNSGLTFHAASRSIVGAARDAGTYRITYKALSGDGVDGASAPEKDAVPAGDSNDSAQWFDEKFFDIVITPSDLNGVIEKITVDDDKPLRKLGGVDRVHLDEGDRATVKVLVKWSHAQIQALNAGKHTASVDVEVIAYDDSAEWLSRAETSERSDGGYGVGDDAVLASKTVSIKIPADPKTNVGSTTHYLTGTGSVSLSLAPDADAEDEAFKIHVVDLTGVNVTTVSPSRTMTDYPILIDDAQTQTIELSKSPSGAVFEGADVTLKAVPKPLRVDLDLDVRYSVETVGQASVSSGTYTVTESVGTIVAADAKQEHTTTFSTPANDKDRVDTDFKITAEVVSFDLSSGAYTHIEDDYVEVTVLDLHKLPPLEVEVSPATGSVKEGESFTLTLTVDRNPATTRRVGGEKVDTTGEALTVMLSPMMSDEYEIMTNPVPIPKHDGKAPWEQDVDVEVMAVVDDRLEGPTMHVLNAEVDGTENAKYGDNTVDDSYTGVAMLTIEDDTRKYVSPKTDKEIQDVIYPAKEAGAGADMIFSPGEMIEVAPASALFNAADGVTLSYTAKSDNEDVATVMVSGSTVMVTADDEVGMAHITITAHASLPSGAKGLPQDDPREASVIFPVETGLAALTIEIKGPADMNIVEGAMDHANGTMAGAMVTAKANRPVTEDVTVTLMRDRAMSTAGDDDFMADPIVIESGKDEGSTMVMAVEDDMMENMDNMPEELVLYGMAEGMAGEVTGQVELYIWDYSVPALPIVAQLLLAAFLALGGYRRYRRR